jgi:hypothetical protein
MLRKYLRMVAGNVVTHGQATRICGRKWQNRTSQLFLGLQVNYVVEDFQSSFARGNGQIWYIKASEVGEPGPGEGDQSKFNVRDSGPTVGQYEICDATRITGLEDALEPWFLGHMQVNVSRKYGSHCQWQHSESPVG